jgi:hypothetical protein
MKNVINEPEKDGFIQHVVVSKFKVGEIDTGYGWTTGSTHGNSLDLLEIKNRFIIGEGKKGIN